MKKLERAFSVFCITSIPCFIFAAVFWSLTKGEIGYAVMAIAFSLFVLYTCFLLRRKTVPHSDWAEKAAVLEEDGSSEEDGSRKIAMAMETIESNADYLKELQERVEQAEKQIDRNNKIIENLVKRQKEDKGSGSFHTAERQMNHVPQIPVSESRTESFSVNCQLKELEKKKELTSEDQFTVIRNGNGGLLLQDFRLLIPKGFATGETYTSLMFNRFKAYSMGKLFDLNSQEVIDHKITKVVPAEIKVLGDKNKNQFKGVLVQKGKIEVDGPVR